ncbi:type II toxin-antitoxin system CcdA family antitoxin [Solimonas marina]|uniref:Type II toxin-antitoxin system CcdA family antitoxin n=1 Tax=Solimonas marina TaxID=2714601 RepID=A0A969WD67_9GAMM|nr:type II toxin-antitoxin system CcdA family antitoxin [Solimonas marina]NKF23920.1 type II toxin-antitoxin system CcdA family antitoxin [Solimonas marina]
MTITNKLPSRKRAVNLFLNEELVKQAQAMTDNLSAQVESMLATFVQQQQQLVDARANRLRRSTEAWNRYAEKHGSFADEFSTL